MKHKLPIVCGPSAFAVVQSRLSSIETTYGLIDIACAVSAITGGGTSGTRVGAAIEEYADVIRRRLRGWHPTARISHLHQFLFDDMNFGGEIDYQDQQAHFLPNVIRAGRGLPIIISIIYKAVAEQIGLRCQGIGLPGHFLVQIRCDGADMLVDPYYKGIVRTREECLTIVQIRFGEAEKLEESWFAPVSNLHWVTRITQNLLGLYTEKGEFLKAGAILELQMLLWPDQDHLMRDYALVMSRAGRGADAIPFLAEYLAKHPEDPQYNDLRELHACLKL